MDTCQGARGREYPRGTPIRRTPIRRTPIRTSVGALRASVRDRFRSPPRRMANSASRASIYPDLTRSPIRNCHCQNPGGLRPRQRMFYAFVIYGNLPGFLRKNGSGTAKFHDSTLKTLRRAYARQNLSRQVFQPRGRGRIPVPASLPPLLKSTAPRKRNMVAWRHRPIPRVMQCPRQDYVWPE